MSLVRRAAVWQIVAVWVVAQALYIATLAPTLLWGDDAKFQRQAYLKDLGVTYMGDHPLWVLAAHPFSHLPIGDVPLRVNLFTSLWAAAAVALAFASLRSLTGSALAATAGAGSLAVSHTFWTHAVRTEVYSMALALLAAALCALLRPRPARWLLVLGGVAAGLAAATHFMMWIAVPGLVLLVAARSRGAGGGGGAARWLVGPAVFVAALAAVAVAYRLLIPDSAAAPSNPLLYLPSARGLAAAVGVFLLYLAMQFPGPALLPLMNGVAEARRNPGLAGFIGLTALLNIGAVLKLGMPDKYVFYLLTYFSCAYLVGLGARRFAAGQARLFKVSHRRALGVLAASVILAPVGIYALLPGVLPRLGVTAERLGIREIPGRPALKYFLFPPKTGYQGARWFAGQALAQAPEGAAIIADYTVCQPMLFLKTVEGVRPDVDVVDVPAPEQTAFALKQAGARPVLLARTDRYYDLEGLGAHFDLVPAGVLYRLTPKQTAHQAGQVPQMEAQ
ncbi:MAG: DUF2723 domain-containing protein [bacterium]